MSLLCSPDVISLDVLKGKLRVRSVWHSQFARKIENESFGFADDSELSGNTPNEQE